MGRQNQIRRDEYPGMYQPPPPSAGLLLRFLAYAPLGMTNGVPSTPPANGAALTSWAPVAGSGPLLQADGTAAPVYQRASAAVLAKVFVAAAKTAAQAAIGNLPVGSADRTLIMIGTGFTPGTVTNGQPLLRYGTLASAGQDFGVGISATDTYVGRTATAQQDNTTIAVDNTKPVLLVMSYVNGITKVKTWAVQDLTHMNAISATRALNTTVGNPLSLGNAAALNFSVFEIMALDHAITTDEFDALLAYVQGMYGFGQN